MANKKNISQTVLSFIKKIDTMGWIYIALLLSSFSLSIHFSVNKVSAERLGIIFGMHIFAIMMAVAPISKKRSILFQKILKFCLFLFFLSIPLRWNYEAYHEHKIRAKNELERYITSTNKNLPIMIDGDTRLENVSIYDENISYTLTAVNILVENLDIPKFELAMKSSIKLSTCATSEAISLLRDNKNIKYTYQDKAGKIISTITIDKKDCL